jgi:peptide/nickel transport system permease protein
MWKIALQRVVMLALMMLLVSILAFIVPMASGSDPARTILMSHGGDLALDPAQVEALRRELGLDQPLAVQFLIWLGNALQGDFGNSFASRQPVIDEIGRALTVSLTLAAAALAFAVAVALPMGTIAAMRPGGRIDGAVTLMVQTFVAIPEYWLAPILIVVFSLHLGILPSSGWFGPSSVILPALALSIRPMAYFTQVTRAAMMDVLEAAWITAARARGLSMPQTVVRHGLRNGAIPVVTFFSLWFASLLGGSVVIEVIFAIPGMGRLFFEAVINRDIPLLQGGFVCIVALAVVINTIADLLYYVINPSLRGSHAR